MYFGPCIENYVKDSPVAVQRLARQFPYASKALHADVACLGITCMGSLHLRYILNASPNLACLERIACIARALPTLKENPKGFLRLKCEDYLLNENWYNRDYLYLYIRYLAKQYLSGNVYCDDLDLQALFCGCKYLYSQLSSVPRGDIRSVVFATYWFPVDEHNTTELFSDNCYFSPETKFLVMIRNPVDTLYSIYKLSYIRLYGTSFEQWIDFDFIEHCVKNNSFPDIQEIYIRFPNYRHVLITYSLKEWFKRFSPEQFYFIPNTLLLKNSTYLIKRLSTILNISEWEYDNSKIYPKNVQFLSNKGFNFPRIHKYIFEIVEKFFQHYNSDFEKLISRAHVIADNELFFSRSSNIKELLKVNTDILSEQETGSTNMESVLQTWEEKLKEPHTGLCLFFLALHLQLYGYALRICELYKDLLPKHIECFITLALLDAKTSDTNLAALRKDMLARLLDLQPPMKTQGYVKFGSKVLLKKCARKVIDDLLHVRFGKKMTVTPAVDTACAFEASREKVALQCAAVPVDSAVSAEMRALALESDLEAGQYVFRKFFDRHFQTKFLYNLAELG